MCSWHLRRCSAHCRCTLHFCGFKGLSPIMCSCFKPNFRWWNLHFCWWKQSWCMLVQHLIHFVENHHVPQGPSTVSPPQGAEHRVLRAAHGRRFQLRDRAAIAGGDDDGNPSTGYPGDQICRWGKMDGFWWWKIVKIEIHLARNGRIMGNNGWVLMVEINLAVCGRSWGEIDEHGWMWCCFLIRNDS